MNYFSFYIEKSIILWRPFQEEVILFLVFFVFYLSFILGIKLIEYFYIMEGFIIAIHFT